MAQLAEIAVKSEVTSHLKVPWSYLPQQFARDRIDAVLGRIGDLVATGKLTLSAPVQEFEQAFAAMVGSRQAIGVNSGTDAIKLSLKALGVGPGDEVITTANTFIATVGAITELHATPVFVDCRDDFCMDVSAVEARITDRTKAIVPVHLAGQMTDMPALAPIADRHGLPLVEDACQCILGERAGKRTGTFGRTGAFSLHPLKNLNVWGDGGVIVTDDDALAAKLRRVRNHGLADRDTVVDLGCNSRLDPVQALVGSWLIGEVPEITRKRIANAARLDAGIGDLPEITLPARDPETKQVYHLYIVFAEERDDLRRFLTDRGIEVKVHYPVPVYRQSALAHLGHAAGDFPVTDRHARTMISLPAHDHLTDEQIDHMIASVRAFYRG